MRDSSPDTNTPASPLERLASVPDVIRARRPAGQVLVYAGHVPQGLFVLLEGRLRLEGEVDEGGEARVVEVVSGGRPLLTVAPTALGDPATTTLVLETDAEVVCVPRSLVKTNATVADLVSDEAFDRLPPEACR
jgi:hypothetical protein